jgi:hypothetical protein
MDLLEGIYVVSEKSARLVHVSFGRLADYGVQESCCCNMASVQDNYQLKEIDHATRPRRISVTTSSMQSLIAFLGSVPNSCFGRRLLYITASMHPSQANIISCAQATGMRYYRADRSMVLHLASSVAKQSL